MLTHQKQTEIAALKLTFGHGNGKLFSNANPNLTREILFGVTEGNNACTSNLKVRKIEVKGDGLPAVFRQLAKEIVEEVGMQFKDHE
jgi:hypothetical protein